MAKEVYMGEVLRNEEIRKHFFLLKIRLPVQFGDPLPGQFVMVRIAGLQDPFLSRPISIYSFIRQPKGCVLELLYRVAGRGTSILAGLMKGSLLEISGPLGGSYHLDPTRKKNVFLAGGIGVAPLSLLARHLCETACTDTMDMTFYLGAQNSEAVVGLDRLREYCYQIIVCTDDGSLGRKTLVTAAFQEDIRKYSPQDTAIYACGPKPMLRSLSSFLGREYFCQVSLEERMACGVGACVGCAVAVKDEAGRQAYRRVCVDGPVFELKNVIWESSSVPGDYGGTAAEV